MCNDFKAETETKKERNKQHEGVKAGRKQARGKEESKNKTRKG